MGEKLNTMPLLNTEHLKRFSYFLLERSSRISQPAPALFRHLVHYAELLIISRFGAWLFNADFYLTQNKDIKHCGAAPLKHFVFHGAEEGRNPSALFDLDFYRKNHMPESNRRTNPVLHFMLVGCEKRLSPSPFFDFDYYEANNTDIGTPLIESYRHFVQYGARENRASSPAFDPSAYIAAHPDVWLSNTAALEHFILHDNADARASLRQVRAAKRINHGYEENRNRDLESAILALPGQDSASAAVDVIVPVYRAKEETLSCLWHVLKSQNKTKFELVVIDDKSPEQTLSESLGRLAAAGKLTLIQNDENLGFVKSVNIGMRRCDDRDVILLNSDTEVYGDWIDRLRTAAYRESKYSTVTPLTNSGTICSYPYFVQDNDKRLETPYEKLDEFAKKNNAGMVIAAPTAVGFCMYIKCDAIRDVGYFDEAAFGRGYGEENDFCLRAQNNGWTDVIAPDIFVRHLGNMSFQGERAGRLQNALKVISARYPNYNRDVQEFIQKDPLKTWRAHIDLERLKQCSGARNVLIISHSRGGGTEQHVQEETRRLGADGYSIFYMRAAFGSQGHVVHSHASAPDLPNLPGLSLVDQHSEIVDLWDDLRIDEIHLHHMADFGLFGARRLYDLLQTSKRPWKYVIHDYLTICPRINLTDETGYYCGEPKADECNKCLTKRRSEFGAPDILEWRAENYFLLSDATERIVPNEDVSERLNRYWPDLEFSVRPHENPVPSGLSKTVRALHRPFRIGTLGAISEIKGFHVLLSCAQKAREMKRPLQFVVVGYTLNDRLATEAGIEIAGAYALDEALKKVDASNLDMIFLASTWPETYCYTLSTAMISGLPIAVFDIGAQAARLTASEVDRQLVLPLDMNSVQINERLTAFLCE